MRLPTYEAAVAAVTRDVIHHLMRAKDPVFGSVRHESVEELPMQAVPLPSGEVLEGGVVAVGGDWILQTSDVLNGSFDGLHAGLDAAADQMLGQIMPAFYELIGKVSDAAGQTLVMGDRPFIDVMIDALESMDLGFDDDGNLTTFIVTSPDMAQKIRQQGEPPPEKLQRVQDIIERKRSEHFDRRSSRRLP